MPQISHPQESSILNSLCCSSTFREDDLDIDNLEEHTSHQHPEELYSHQTSAKPLDPMEIFFLCNKGTPSLDRFNNMLQTMKLEEVEIPRNGSSLVFMLSIALQARGIIKTGPNILTDAMQRFRMHGVSYMQHFGRQVSVQSHPRSSYIEELAIYTSELSHKLTTPNSFLLSCLKFFETGDCYNEFIANVCLSACAHALGVNLLVFHRNESNVTVTKLLPTKPCSSVYLYLQLCPWKKTMSKNCHICMAHYNCYVDKTCYQSIRQNIEYQLISPAGPGIGLASDSLLPREFNSPHDTWQQAKEKGERYVNCLLILLFTYFIEICICEI